MYSLNVPVPARVAQLASDLARDLPTARPRTRGEHTLGVKRLGDDEPYSRLETQVRELLTGQQTFEICIDGVDYFPNAITGPTPVIYLCVDSPELERLHRHLAETFDPIEGIEGEGYTPHVTVARGGRVEEAERIAEREIEPISWTVSELIFWDALHRKSVSTVSLPA